MQPDECNNKLILLKKFCGCLLFHVRIHDFHLARAVASAPAVNAVVAAAAAADVVAHKMCERCIVCMLSMSGQTLMFAPFYICSS